MLFMALLMWLTSWPVVAFWRASTTVNLTKSELHLPDALRRLFAQQLSWECPSRLVLPKAV
ncbi:MAG: hypothetical protein QOJ99_3966 [Bryobacterales bacterium]|jgi:hypothetical protein|nr:hypothetical protein [Bryobacterales bacterium]